MLRTVLVPGEKAFGHVYIYVYIYICVYNVKYIHMDIYIFVCMYLYIANRFLWYEFSIIVFWAVLFEYDPLLKWQSHRKGYLVHRYRAHGRPGFRNAWPGNWTPFTIIVETYLKTSLALRDYRSLICWAWYMILQLQADIYTVLFLKNCPA